MNVAADLMHVSDVKGGARYKLLGSPALVINDKLASLGEIPPKSKICQWMIEAYNTE